MEKEKPKMPERSYEKPIPTMGDSINKLFSAIQMRLDLALDAPLEERKNHYNKEKISNAAKIHINKIRDLYESVEEITDEKGEVVDKVRIFSEEQEETIEEFCKFAENLPDEPSEEYLQELQGKYNDAKKAVGKELITEDKLVTDTSEE